jgi:hypothetical protein
MSDQGGKYLEILLCDVLRLQNDLLSYLELHVLGHSWRKEYQHGSADFGFETQLFRALDLLRLQRV